MYKRNKIKESTLTGIQPYEGITIEERIRKLLNSGEPITDGAPIIYTDRASGVQPQYDIRTDRFEIAIDAMDKVQKQKIAEREARIVNMKEERAKKDEKKEITNGSHTSEQPSGTE